MAIKKANRKYTVIANHESNISKVVTKYCDEWKILNLNCIIYNPIDNIDIDNKKDIIYYGSFRKGRIESFKKYLSGDNIIVSTHKKNRDKFLNNDIKIDNFIDRINWSKDGLSNYKFSIYIEDEKNHTSYNHLANRFYEALNYNVIPLFSSECKNTIELSGYKITDDYIFNSNKELIEKSNCLSYNKDLFIEWNNKAKLEKIKVIEDIKKIIL